MNKFVSAIIFIGAAAFLAYMLISGQAYIAWERIIIYALIGGGISLVGRARSEKLKKQDEEYFKKHPEEKRQEDALWKNVSPRATEGDDSYAASAQLSASGVVRTSIGIRGIIIFLLIFIWVVILGCTALAAADGAFADMDGDTIGSFGALIAVAAAATIVFTWFLNTFCCEIYYTPGGVTVKKGKKEQQYSWSEIGSYTQRNYLYTFRDREGKRLFFTNSSYEGFGGFFDQYLRTHSRN